MVRSLSLYRRDGLSDLALRWAACVRPMGWPDHYRKDALRAFGPAVTMIFRSVVILEALGQLVDILRRPTGHFHAEMQAHLRQYLLDLVQRLAAEVRGAKHLRFRLLHEVADVDDVVVLQAVCRTDRQFELVHLLEERRIECEIR